MSAGEAFRDTVPAGRSGENVARTDVAARINRLPPSPYFLRLVGKVSLIGLFEFYDLFLVAYVAAALLQARFLTAAELPYFVASGFAGMFFGTTLFGRIADRTGRRNGITYSLLLYSAFTLAAAFSPDATWLIALRFLAGIGIGAQLVTIDAYVTEMTPRTHRGFYIAFSQVITFLAVPLVAVLAYLLVPRHFGMAGWRYVVLVGGLGAALVWWQRRHIPESARWLEAHGEPRAAEVTVLAMEAAVQREQGKPLPPAEPVPPEERSGRAFAELWSATYRGRTAMLMAFQLLQTLGFYGFASWVPVLLLHEGVTIVHSLEYTFIIAIANPFGPVLAMVTAERVQRKHLIVSAAVLIAVAGLAFSQARSAALIIVLGILITLLNNAFSAYFHSYQAELYPTRIRATGVGFTYSWSRLSAVFTSFLIAYLLAHFGTTGVFVAISAAMLLVAVVIGGFGPRTNRQPLEVLAR